MTAAQDRPWPRRAWVATAALTAVLLVPPGALYGWSWLAASSRTDDVTLHHRVDALRLDAPRAQLVLRPGPDDQVHLRATRQWSLREPAVTSGWDGDTLAVTVGQPGPDLDSLASRVTLEIELPARASVQASTASGSIDLAGLAGALRLSTGSGSITVADSGGALEASTDSGRLRATELGAGAVTVRTGSGLLALAFSTPPSRLSASVGDGRLDVALPPGSRYQLADSASGSQALRVPAGLADPGAAGLISVQIGDGSAALGY
ncbi:DUF4097 domain-containing protein [Kitasatospora sp. NBC_01287]|uniref:DUF4097 family beta strand repeat-containing protein n=1 Tax=Kitasatospora sp. NBC_01287 TaxID=2903573 RepID=UPI0022541AAE|nr:DUF4097 family beta strand repeat-containing protein [Kitasatospora sp. NBC_01287]MCX4745775.1 DUF4097 domain-containing protein [Kitasatospora sp. NBC_01287]